MRWNFPFSDTFHRNTRVPSRNRSFSRRQHCIHFVAAHPNFRDAVFRSHSLAGHHNGHRGHGPVGHFIFHRQLGVLRSQKESNTSKCLYNSVKSGYEWIEANYCARQSNPAGCWFTANAAYGFFSSPFTTLPQVEKYGEISRDFR